MPGFSRLLDANDLARRMLRRCDLEEVQVPRSQRQLALAQVPLVDLQIFWVHTQLHHMPPDVQGPDWIQQKEVCSSAVAAGIQRGGTLSKHALPPLHPLGLSKLEHVAESAKVASPLIRIAPLILTWTFCCWIFVAFGPWARTWRKGQLCRNLPRHCILGTTYSAKSCCQ